MRYIIIGAGAVGGTIGARLLQAGHDVVLTARGAHLDALRRGGLRFATPNGTVTMPVTAVGGPGELSLRADDVLILAVKTQDSAAALDAWAWQPVNGGEVAAEVLPVCCAQNGVASERGSSWRRVVVAEPDPRQRVDRGRLSQRRDRPARP
jgi:2-dehydropantoate 2-reductase